MSGSLSHSPADIVLQALIDQSFLVDPDEGSGDYMGYSGGEPGSPDRVVTIYDTTGRVEGRDHNSGDMMEHYGLQIRVRGREFTETYAKADAIKVAVDEKIKYTHVTIDSSNYLIHAITRTTGVIPLGKEAPNSKRSLFTINALVSVRKL